MFINIVSDNNVIFCTKYTKLVEILTLFTISYNLNIFSSFPKNIVQNFYISKTQHYDDLVIV